MGQRAFIRIAIRLPVILLLAAHALGQTPDSETKPPEPWAHHLTFSDPDGAIYFDGVQSIAFSPDGRYVYVHRFVRVINVWAVILQYWPKVMGGLLVLLTILLLFRVKRIWARPQASGTQYCRKCNYNLSSHSSVVGEGATQRVVVMKDARCPECGVELRLRTPCRGRSGIRRVAMVGCMWLTTAMALGGLYLFEVLRDVSGVDGPFWPSTDLVRVADRLAPSRLGDLIDRANQVFEVDVISGEILRTVVIAQEYSFTPITMAPDGRTLFIQGPGPNDVSRYAISDGRMLSSVTYPGKTSISPSSGGDSAAIGFSPNGGTAYVQWFDKDRVVNGVSAWNLAGGTLETIVETAAYRDPKNSSVWTRHFLTCPGPGPPQFLSVPNFMEAFSTKTYRIRRHIPGQADYVEYEPEPRLASHGQAAITPDGQLFINNSEDVENLVLIDLLTGETDAVIPAPSDEFLNFTRNVISPDGAILASSSVKGVSLLNLKERRWIGTLEAPDGLIAGECYFSPDNRWLGVVFQKTIKGGTTKDPVTGIIYQTSDQFTHELVLWDMNSVRAMFDSRPETMPEANETSDLDSNHEPGRQSGF